MKKNKKKINIEEVNMDKLTKVFKIVLIVCIVIIIVEAGLFFYTRYKNEQNTTYYDSYNMVLNNDNEKLAVGSSYFKYSKLNDYTGGYEKGKFIKLDSKGNTVFEFQYDKGNNSTFTSVLELDDSYIVTGSGEYSDEQTTNKTRDAFIIKFDKNGKKIWEKYLNILSNTRFTKAIKVDDGIVVIGTSIYEDMEVGNHSTGGGIIVKYDFDGNEIWRANHGGNKSGEFTGIVEVDGNFYVSGKDGADSGNIVKFSSTGEYKWHKNFSYTDGEGLKDIAYYNNQLYVVGSKKILEDENAEERKTTNTDGIVLVYDLKGNLKDQYTFGGSSYERFTSIAVLNDNIFIGGLTSSTDIEGLDVKFKKSADTLTTGIVLKYDSSMKLISSTTLGGSNNDSILSLTTFNGNIYASGFSNSKDGSISTKDANGKDYFGKIIELDENLNTDVIK